MKSWKLVKDDASHWHYEQRRGSALLERLESYDIQFTMILNPLNWRLGRFTDYSGVKEISLGPFRLMTYCKAKEPNEP